MPRPPFGVPAAPQPGESQAAFLRRLQQMSDALQPAPGAGAVAGMAGVVGGAAAGQQGPPPKPYGEMPATNPRTGTLDLPPPGVTVPKFQAPARAAPNEAGFGGDGYFTSGATGSPLRQLRVGGTTVATADAGAPVPAAWEQAIMARMAAAGPMGGGSVGALGVAQPGDSFDSANADLANAQKVQTLRAYQGLSGATLAQQGQDKELASREALAQYGTAADAERLKATLGNQSAIARGEMDARQRVAELESASRERIAANADPRHGLRAELLLRLAGMKEQNPNIDLNRMIDNLGGLTNHIDRVLPNALPSSLDPTPGRGPGVGPPPPAGPVGPPPPQGPDPAQQADAVLRLMRERLTKPAEGPGGVTGYTINDAKLGGDSIQGLLDALGPHQAALDNPDVRGRLADEFRRGAFGDTTKLRHATAQELAAQTLLTQFDALAKNNSVLSPTYKAPPIGITGTGGTPLATLRYMEPGALGNATRLLGNLYKGTTVPYNRLDLPTGETIDFDRGRITGLGQLFGDSADERKRQAPTRQARAAAILEMLSGK